MAHKPNRTTSSSSPQSHRFQKNPLTSPDALCSHRSHRAIDWKQPAAQTGGTAAPLWLSPSAPSPLLALLNCAYPAPAAGVEARQERSLRRPAAEEHLPFRLRLISPPLCPHPSLAQRNVNKDFVFYFFCIVFVIR